MLAGAMTRRPVRSRLLPILVLVAGAAIAEVKTEPPAEAPATAQPTLIDDQGRAYLSVEYPKGKEGVTLGIGGLRRSDAK